MPERFDLGGAAFHLVISSAEFNRALSKAEADARAASQKIAASLSGAGRGGAVIAPKIDVAPAQQSFNRLEASAKQARTAASFTATPKVDTTQAQRSVGGLGTGLKGLFAIGAGAAGVTLGIAALGEAITGSVAAAQEANQAQRALNATYGASAGQFTAFADAQAAALGRSNVEFKHAAVAAATLSRNYGLTGEQIQTVIRRSTDLATIQGIGVVDATSRVTSALRGEAEAAEILGLTLNSDAIKAIAEMTAEQRKNFETLDLITKAQITYREFLRQTAFAEGQAAKAAADGVTAYDQAGAAFGNLATAAGSVIDPIGKGAAGALRDSANAAAEFIRQTQQLPGWAQRATALSEPNIARRVNDDPEARRALQFEALRQERGKQAAADAQLARAEAKRLGDIAKDSQAEITKTAIEGIDDRRKAAAQAASEERDRINEGRDAAIAASQSAQTAALRRLDAESQARDTARIREDRARDAAQQATLRGLEKEHNTVLRNLEGEQTAVERKRDAALRALDEEAKREDRRHDQAIRNIDRERDAKLGVIDRQLAAIDAAAERDQRAQTDQSLARSLADARQDLRRAESSEERARARRAIADAQAAIQREQINRQREDQRAALRAQAEQIRAAAEAAKEIEEIRNRTTTTGIAGRRTDITTQAQQEIESIRLRVEKEKEGFAQTVQDQRDAFALEGQNLADRRRNEDIALAARRQGLQDHYAAEQADIRATSKVQLDELEQRTANTIAELDKDEQTWTDWREHVEKEIAAAISAGDPSRIRNLTATPPQFQNQGAGPGEPPSRLEAAGNLTQTGNALAATIIEGVSGTLAADDQTAKDVVTWVDTSIIDPAYAALEAQSPSKVFERLAGFAVDGFVQGLQGSETIIGQAFVQAFDAAWAQYLQPWFTGGNGLQTQLGVHFADAASGLNTPATQEAAGTAMFGVLQEGYESNVIPWFSARDGLGAQLGKHFATSAKGLNSPATQRAVGDAMRVALGTGLNLALARQELWWDAFEDLGRALAISTSIGWLQQWRETPLVAPRLPSLAPSTSGTGVGTRSLREDFITSSGGSQNFIPSATFSPSSSFGGGTWPSALFRPFAGGGWVNEPTWLVNARTGQISGSMAEYRPEYISPSGPALRMPDFNPASANYSRAGHTFNMTVQVDARGVQNADQLVERAMPKIERHMVAFLEAVERGAPDPVSNSQAGAM